MRISDWSSDVCSSDLSGLSGLRVVPGIFDLDRHMIPEHKGVPAHWHYDVRYVVVAGRDEDFAVSEESLDLAWRDIAAVAEDTSADESLRRMAAKWLARAISEEHTSELQSLMRISYA